MPIRSCHGSGSWRSEVKSWRGCVVILRASFSMCSTGHPSLQVCPLTLLVR